MKFLKIYDLYIDRKIMVICMRKSIQTHAHAQTNVHTHAHTQARIHNDGIQRVRNGSNESFTKITPNSQNRFLNSLGIRNHR